MTGSHQYLTLTTCTTPNNDELCYKAIIKGSASQLYIGLVIYILCACAHCKRVVSTELGYNLIAQSKACILRYHSEQLTSDQSGLHGSRSWYSSKDLTCLLPKCPLMCITKTCLLKLVTKVSLKSLQCMHCKNK